jgi:hypothetical protein
LGWVESNADWSKRFPASLGFLGRSAKELRGTPSRFVESGKDQFLRLMLSPRQPVEADGERAGTGLGERG